MRKLFLKSILLLCALIVGMGNVLGTVTWSRVTSVQTLLDGGTFIIGYEATANSGVIVPMANTGSATTSAAGFMYSGSTATSGGTGTINMSSVETTSGYEVEIGESSEVSGAIYIKVGNNYLGNTNTKNNCKLFTSQATTTSFTPTFGTNNTCTLDIAVNTSGSAYRYLKYNTGSPRFAVYATAPEKIVIYKKIKGTPSLSFSPATLEATIGKAYSLPTLTSNAESGTVSYSSSDQTVATVNSSTGALTLIKAGTTRITATAEETSTQNSASAYYDLTVLASSVSAPTIDVASGTYDYNTAVTITTTEEDIYYTTDETDPATSGTAISADGKSVTVYITHDMTLKAISLDGELNVSAPTIREYIVTRPDAPSFSVDPGTYNDAQSVDISSPFGTTISYTTDGTDPRSSNTAIITDDNITTINVSVSTTIRAITIDAYAFESTETSGQYKLKVKTPSFSTLGGVYDDAQSVELTCLTEGTIIYYTTDGTNPTTESDTYSSAINVSTVTTLKAIAMKDGWTNSSIATAKYIIVPPTSLPFNWDGGSSADLKVREGVYTDGLGSDYAAGNSPYLVKMDGTGDFIGVRTTGPIGKVTIKIKMLGGSETSSITVQGSADGVSFSEVELLAISGDQNDILTLETTKSFALTDRWVRLYFTKGSNIGVGPISVSEKTESVTISSAGWATFSSTNALDFTNVDGVEAYLVGGVTGSTLNLSDAQGKVPAGTGLLLNGEAGSYDIPVIASASPVGTNKLVACTSETVLPVNADHYVLVNDGGAVFQNLSEHGATIHAGKAYLNLSGASAPSIIRIVDENNNATDIQSVEEIDKAVKFLENGQLLIKRGNIIYDAMGRVIR